MASKSLINSINDAVNQSLNGHVLTYPDLDLHVKERVVLSPICFNKREKVALISGGGSGHEPFASGFVGSGMLTASVAGSIFAAPPSKNIFHAIKCVTANTKAGCFVIIPNYTGDCLNFGLAIEKAKLLNIKVSQVIVDDDCSIPEKDQGRAGSRGLSGLMFVMKIAGALAEEGRKIEEVSKYTQLVVNNLATCGVGLVPCAIPGQTLMFELPKDEVELGLGIHGEAGYKRMKSKRAYVTVGLMLSDIVKTLNLTAGTSVAMIINNFGALSQLEQGIVVDDAVKHLENIDVVVHRVYSGVLMTSLNGSGVHITVLKLPENDKKLLLCCLDAKTDAPRWPGCKYSRRQTSKHDKVLFDESKEKAVLIGPRLDSWQRKLLRACLQNACKAIIEKEFAINELDKGCGDGDCGTTLREFTDGILKSFENLTFSHPSTLFSELASIAEDFMGGTSGALYSLMLAAAAGEVTIEKKGEIWPSIWSRAFRAGINRILLYSKVKLGDKTMLDALDPACKEFEKIFADSYREVAQKVADAAYQGGQATKNMVARAGRASYVKQAKYLKDVDAGAIGVVTWLTAIAETIINFH